MSNNNFGIFCLNNNELENILYFWMKIRCKQMPRHENVSHLENVKHLMMLMDNEMFNNVKMKNYDTLF